ncbi:hypothetical protein IWQ60_000202 [Tieghemiomyces parasiticus]|uniref:Pre-mRNA-processing factor 17 n=1 Tax=Tieghemiomyces parasiticus TaxID=78921 RepID=A0A9W8AG92_9FUNG|nr:hypothetical protein IWQ60_000202 [Tieghemiomyces parasiticus]
MSQDQPSRVDPSKTATPTSTSAKPAPQPTAVVRPPFTFNPAPLPTWITTLTPFSAPKPSAAVEPYAPVVGPANPQRSNALAQYDLKPNVLTGHVNRDTFSEFTFRQEERQFRRTGVAHDPSLIGNDAAGIPSAADQLVHAHHRLTNANTAAATAELEGLSDRARGEAKKKARLPKGDPGVFEGEDAYRGPWAGYRHETIGQKVGLTTEQTTGAAVESAPSQAVGKRTKVIQPGEETSVFHGKEERDYQGRTYIHVPTDLDHLKLTGPPGEQVCYVPKRLVHTWSGHGKGVSAIRFFPNSGHLLLSSSMDGRVKLWDVYHQRRCLRTFVGHNKAVRDITFSNDGRRFLSAGYDRYIKLWDTETGQCLSSFAVGAVPYCVTFHPDDDKQNVFLAGCSNKKIMQYDTDTGAAVQEYNQHVDAVNTVTFVDQGRRFVSTSDDKSMRVWEYGIPIVIKLLAEPDMHSLPAVTLSPNHKHLACQSLDNRIVIFQAGEKVRLNPKKSFTGHLVAGYACQPNFSPDGRFVLSGDAEGYLWFWQWKSGRRIEKIKAHDDVVIGCAWHPQETSKVATCSWDGLIKYWD